MGQRDRKWKLQPECCCVFSGQKRMGTTSTPAGPQRVLMGRRTQQGSEVRRPNSSRANW